MQPACNHFHGDKDIPSNVPLELHMFSAALEWLGQEHRIDPAVLTNRVLIQLNDGDNVIGRNSLGLADPKYDGLRCFCVRAFSHTMPCLQDIKGTNNGSF